jgi:hypothetical protein
VIASQQSGSLERRAYREAGHAVMSFLILKAGVVDDLFLMPIASVSRPCIVARFGFVGCLEVKGSARKPRRA